MWTTFLFFILFFNFFCLIVCRWHGIGYSLKLYSEISQLFMLWTMENSIVKVFHSKQFKNTLKQVWYFFLCILLIFVCISIQFDFLFFNFCGNVKSIYAMFFTFYLRNFLEINECLFFFNVLNVKNKMDNLSFENHFGNSL